MRRSKRAAQVLRAARELVAKPRGWTKGGSHNRTMINGRMVHSYCASGAVFAAGGTVADVARLDALVPREATRPWAKPTVVGYNDLTSTRKKDVLSLFDRAIALADPTEAAASEP